MRLVWIAMLAALVAAPVALAAGCNKPSEEDCKKAVTNIRKLTNTDRDDFGVKPEAAIRSCRGNASKASVKCARDAKSLEDLEKCEGGIADAVLGKEKGSEGSDDKPDDKADDKATDGDKETP